MNEHELTPGTLIDNSIEVLSCIGGAGQFRQYLAKHLRHRGHILVHIVPAEGNQAPILKELEHACAVAHNSLANKCGCGVVDSSSLYIAEHYPAGDQLGDLLGPRGGSAKPSQVAARLRQLLDALDHVHSHGLFHGMLAPRFVLVENAESDSEIIRLLGVGVTQAVAAKGLQIAFQEDAAYLAPEVVAGSQRPNFECDLYSVGMIALMMVAGTDAMSAVQNPRELAACLKTSPFSEVITRALAPKARDRFGNIGAFREAIEQVASRLTRGRSRADDEVGGFDSALSAVVGTSGGASAVAETVTAEEDWMSLLPDASTKGRHSTLAAIEAELAFSGVDENKFNDLLANASEDNAQTKVSGPPQNMVREGEILSRPPITLLKGSPEAAKEKAKRKPQKKAATPLSKAKSQIEELRASKKPKPPELEAAKKAPEAKGKKAKVKEEKNAAVSAEAKPTPPKPVPLGSPSEVAKPATPADCPATALLVEPAEEVSQATTCGEADAPEQVEPKAVEVLEKTAVVTDELERRRTSELPKYEAADSRQEKDQKKEKKKRRTKAKKERDSKAKVLAALGHENELTSAVLPSVKSVSNAPIEISSDDLEVIGGAKAKRAKGKRSGNTALTGKPVNEHPPPPPAKNANCEPESEELITNEFEVEKPVVETTNVIRRPVLEYPPPPPSASPLPLVLDEREIVRVDEGEVERLDDDDVVSLDEADVMALDAVERLDDDDDVVPLDEDDIVDSDDVESRNSADLVSAGDENDVERLDDEDVLSLDDMDVVEDEDSSSGALDGLESLSTQGAKAAAASAPLPAERAPSEEPPPQKKRAFTLPKTLPRTKGKAVGPDVVEKPSTDLFTKAFCLPQAALEETAGNASAPGGEPTQAAKETVSRLGQRDDVVREQDAEKRIHSNGDSEVDDDTFLGGPPPPPAGEPTAEFELASDFGDEENLSEEVPLVPPNQRSFAPEAEVIVVRHAALISAPPPPPSEDEDEDEDEFASGDVSEIDITTNDDDLEQEPEPVALPSTTPSSWTSNPVVWVLAAAVIIGLAFVFQGLRSDDTEKPKEKQEMVIAVSEPANAAPVVADTSATVEPEGAVANETAPSPAPLPKLSDASVQRVLGSGALGLQLHPIPLSRLIARSSLASQGSGAMLASSASSVSSQLRTRLLAEIEAKRALASAEPVKELDTPPKESQAEAEARRAERKRIRDQKAKEQSDLAKADKGKDPPKDPEKDPKKDPKKDPPKTGGFLDVKVD